MMILGKGPNILKVLTDFLILWWGGRIIRVKYIDKCSKNTEEKKNNEETESLPWSGPRSGMNVELLGNNKNSNCGLCWDCLNSLLYS